MGMLYATVADIEALWRPLSSEEQERAGNLLPVICSSLRTSAKQVGVDLDAQVAADEDLAEVAKSVTVDVAARTLMTSTDSEPVTSMQQSALGYSVNATYLVPGGGLFIKDSELARLGLKRQRMGVIDLAGPLKPRD